MSPTQVLPACLSFGFPFSYNKCQLDDLSWTQEETDQKINKLPLPSAPWQAAWLIPGSSRPTAKGQSWPKMNQHRHNL